MNKPTLNQLESQHSLQFMRIDSMLFISMFSKAYYTIANDDMDLEFILN